jgi:hypothetical protein
VRGRCQAELDTASDGSGDGSNVGAEANNVMPARCVLGGHLFLYCFDVGGVV